MPAGIDRALLSTRPTRALARLLAAGLFEGRPLTARGRFLNPLVLAQHALWRRLPPLRRVERPIFVVGCGRSGTTLLASWLGLAREVGYLNEPKALWHAAFPHEDLVGNFTRAPARLWLTAEDASEPVRRSLAHSYGAFLFLTGTRRVLDKYPELVFRVPFVRALFPDALFLWLVRSGADTARSIAAWSRRAAGRGPRGRPVDWWGRERRKHGLLVQQGAAREADLAPALARLAALERPEDLGALEWLLAMRAGQAAARDFPGLVLPVRYEELVRDPRAVLSVLLAALGLAPDPRLLEHAARGARPPAVGPPLALDPCLQGPFERTQLALGY